jgi:ferredoxin
LPGSLPVDCISEVDEKNIDPDNWVDCVACKEVCLKSCILSHQEQLNLIIYIKTVKIDL